MLSAGYTDLGMMRAAVSIFLGALTALLADAD